MKAAWAVYCKEIVDALRDRRTLAVVLVSSVLLGPLVLVALSGLLAQFELQAEKRVVVVSGIEHAPSLKNYFERQTYTVQAAPKDHEDLLRRSKFGDPVLVVPEGFEAALLHGDRPVLEIVSDSGNRQAEAGAGRVRRLVDGFARERGALALAMRGVAAEVLEPVDLAERDLASQQSRASQLTSMLPFFVLMAVLYGALNAALDTTAGERERGSLEPLVMTPAPRAALVAGKWAAVASVSTLIAVLSCLSFLPSQWLLRSDTLQALFQFGWVEAGLFIAVLVPLACALSALLMALAIRCRTFKEAQAASSVLLLAVSMLPLVTIFNQDGEAPWHLWVPALAQHTLMTRVLKGEPLPFEMMAVPLGVCTVLSVVGVVAVAKSLRAAAVR
ncbi:ABC transporter permease [Rhizobacter sp. Root1221]|uniref:ABC transporter permease n=1 Tax=Rhizobacter sp. Root1221 TaxID=1736433 RepID=UPI0006FACCA8|nr:ABC transporter permease [Rhizobacter sp. Root1221]KQV99541.1 sodium ABC transporter permease [Rhizobacter sp. Root1221]